MRSTVTIIFLLFILATGCDNYLDHKSNLDVTIPEKIKDLQALLDNDYLINQRNIRAAEASADDYFLTDADWASLNEFDRRIYTWEKQRLFPPTSNNDWGIAYSTVYTANTVLANIDKTTRAPGDQVEWNNAKGHALFLRAQAFLQIASIWAIAYDRNTANTELGIPLRLDPDLNQRSVRATLQQTYQQIIDDLKAAAELLPNIPEHLVRPSKTAAYALLARVYLFMNDYDNMGIYAGMSLQLKSSLKDFNTLQTEPPAPFPFSPRFSNKEEVIMDGGMMNSPLLSRAKVATALYLLFEEKDLRKKLFFRSNVDGTYSYRGSYSGSGVLFSGLSVNEVYLMRAEYYARAGNVLLALEDLNKLLEKRYRKSDFVPLTAHTGAEAISLILKERRKELLMRGLRWMDIKRLNKEGANIILNRMIRGQLYQLEPNDRKYALPIPEDVIGISGMAQNPR